MAWRRLPRYAAFLLAALCSAALCAAMNSRNATSLIVEGERYGAGERLAVTADTAPQPQLNGPQMHSHSGPCKTWLAIWLIRTHGAHLEVLVTTSVSSGASGTASVVDVCASREATLDAAAAEAEAYTALERMLGLSFTDTDFLTPVVQGAWRAGASPSVPAARLYTFVGALAPSRLRALSSKLLARCSAQCRFVDVVDAFAGQPRGAASVAAWVRADDSLVREYLVPFVATSGKDPVQCVGAAAVAKAGGVNHIERWPVTRAAHPRLVGGGSAA